MTAIMINQTTTADDKVAYAFTSRGVEYTVIAGYGYDNDEFAVWSDRLGHASRTPPVVMSLREMAKRSKALAHLVALIKETPSAMVAA